MQKKLVPVSASAIPESTESDQIGPTPPPPVAKKETKVTEIHGCKLVDDYAWLRQKDDPEVAAYLEAENAYAEAILTPTTPLQAKLYDEMLARIKETDVQVPYRQGEYFYYSRTEKGKQYAILCRKHDSLDAAEEIPLDVNQLAEGQRFMSVGVYAVSEDGRWLAYSTDNTGFRQYTLYVKDLNTGELLPDSLEKTGSAAWANDNRTLFYTVEDATKRHYRLYRHLIGSAPSEDQLLYEERDERFNLYVYKARSKDFIFLESGSHTSTEVRYLAASQPAGEWKLLESRRVEIEYYPEHHGDFFYLRVNDTGRDFRIVKAPVGDPGKDHWQEVVAYRPGVMLDHLQLFRDFYVVLEREAGLQQINVTALSTGQSHRVQFPEPAYSLGPENNREFDTKQYRYRYMSLVTPTSVYDHDMEKQASTLLKRTEVLGGYDPARYQVERRFATATDGVRIPISLVYLKSTERNGTAPLYLYAYGSYGIPQDVGFNSTRFSLVHRGVIYAVAHIRGGGDLGKVWHDNGRMLKKMTSFTDFIACAEYLTSPLSDTPGLPDAPGSRSEAELTGESPHPSASSGPALSFAKVVHPEDGDQTALQYGDRNKLVIEGGSAGGLLMGAVANLRPELFKAIVAKVPFLDVINTMLDESLPLTVGEFEEWGNPKKQPEFEYMLPLLAV